MARVIYLTKVFLLNLLRQKSMAFSTLVLPALIMWSTWWVTADLPMDFELVSSGKEVHKSMIDVHVVTGALTAMAITAGIFGFILVAENRKTNTRLELFGYSPGTINLASFLSLFSVMTVAIVMVTYVTTVLTDVEDWQGVAVSVILITSIYASLGILVASILENVTEGTLFILIFAFIDLMLLTNPMGGGVYLKTWTHFLPGFWPVQISMDAAFVGDPDYSVLIYPVLYFLAIIFLIITIRSTPVKKLFRRK